MSSITGYRHLTSAEIATINAIKNYAEMIGRLVDGLSGPENHPDIDQRWVSIGRTHLQEGFMALIRAVAKPTTF